MNFLPLLPILAADLDTLAKYPGVSKLDRVLPGEPAIIHIRMTLVVTSCIASRGLGEF